MPSQSKKAIQRRNKRKRNSEAKAAKLAAAQAALQVLQPEECEICYASFCQTGCTACPSSKFFGWKDRNCECPDPKICNKCVVGLIASEVERCCLSVDCDEKVVKCPWCRNKINITIYHNRLEGHFLMYPDEDTRPPINADEFWS